MTALPAPRSHGHGIFSLDSGYLRPDFDAIHLVIEAGRAIIIEEKDVAFRGDQERIQNVRP